MPVIRLSTRIAAPAGRCFDLARDVDTHQGSTARTKERVVGGVTSGLLGLGDRVTWEATHFGLRRQLTSRITEFDRPNRFVDEMVSGPFKRLVHTHTFVPEAGETLMLDEFDYESPFGPLGRLADRLFLERYMTDLLRTRNAYLKRAAES